MYPLIQKYKEAWEKHDINILKEIFNADSEYTEKIGQETLQGLKQIINYWTVNSKLQENVEFTPREIILQNIDQLEFRWEAKFYRKDLRKNLFLNGTMRFDLKNGKIQNLSEEFTKTFLD